MLRATGYNKSAVSAQTSPHPRYHFHGYGGENVTGDSKFFDRSGMGNHAVRGANLSEANMLANAGYVSTIDPAGGATDSVLRIPNLNFDYAGGEKLILYWLGKATPEGADVDLLGDGYDSTYKGFSITVTTSGKAKIKLVDATGTYYSASTNATAFDGTLHSVGVTIDGDSRKVCLWVDEVLDTINVFGPLIINSGSAIDTKNTQTVNIGASLPSAAASTVGIASQTRSLHILKLTASDSMPHTENISNTFENIRPDPAKPILAGGFNTGGLPWFDSLLLDGQTPKMALQFANNRYAVNGIERDFADFLTHTRGSTATYIDSSGLVATAAINTPRFTYDPTTLDALGLLVEEARTNLLLHNSDFTNAAWVKVNGSANKNATGPDGVSNSGSTLTSTSANATFLQSLVLAADTRSFSIYLKRKTGTGVVSITRDGVNYTPVALTSSWIKFEVNGTSVLNPVCGVKIDTSGDEVYAFGAQDEEGGHATSYIPTTTAAVTRSSDAIIWDKFGVYCANLSKGTVFQNYAQTALASWGGFSMSIGGSNTMYLGLGYQSSSSLDGNTYYKNNTLLAVTVGPGAAPTRNVFLKEAARYDDSIPELRRARDGAIGSSYSQVVTATSMTNLRIGTSEFAPTSSRNALIKEILYYDFAATSSEMQRITS